MWIFLVYFPLILIVGSAILSVFITNKHNSFRFYSRFVYIYCVTIFITLILQPVFFLIPKNQKNGTLVGDFVTFLVNDLLGIKVTLKGKSKLPENGCIFVSNHQSSIDCLGLFAIWKELGNCVAVVKKEIFYIWPVGLTAYLCRTVFIDRRNKEAAKRTLHEITEMTTHENYRILFYVEGTRNTKKLEPMLPFKKGAFLAAIHAQVPIVPMVYSPSYFLNQKTHFFDDNPRIIMEILDPISTKGLTENDVNHLIETTRNGMMDCYKKYLEEFKSQLGPNYPGTLV